MKLIKKFRNSDFGYDNKYDIDYIIRKAARCIVFNSEGKTAIIHAKNIGIHKIPGGGLNPKEEILEGLKRELIEESGSIVTDLEELGMIIEYRDDIEKKLISYCFIGKEINNIGHNFTDKEISQGFELSWLDLDEAIKLMEKDKPVDYHAEFMLARDLEFLKEYSKKVNAVNRIIK